MKEIIRTQFLMACSLGDIPTIDKHLGALDINFQNDKGCTALMLASGRGRKEVVDLLIKNNAHIDTQDHSGMTSLMHAVHAIYFSSAKPRFLSTMNTLMNNGANVGLAMDSGSTALDIAIKNSDFCSIITLKQEMIDHKDSYGDTYLMRACENKDEFSILFLHKKGADFFIENNNGDSAFKILKRKRNLPEKLVSLKESLILSQLISQDDMSCKGL